jgi:hypothetical protein
VESSQHWLAVATIPGGELHRADIALKAERFAIECSLRSQAQEKRLDALESGESYKHEKNRISSMRQSQKILILSVPLHPLCNI